MTELPADVLAEVERIVAEAPPVTGDRRGELRTLLRPLPAPGRRAS